MEYKLISFFQESTEKHMAKKFLVLPPIEKRKFTGILYRNKMFRTVISSPEKNDEYVIYLQYKYRLIIGYIISALLLLSYILGLKCDIGPWKVCVFPENKFDETFSISFGVIFAFVDFFAITPLSLLLFIKNVEWKNQKYVVPGQHLPMQGTTKEKLQAALDSEVKALVAMVIVGYAGAPFAGLFLSYMLGIVNSKIYLAAMAIVLPASFAGLWTKLFMLVVGHLNYRNKALNMK